MTEATKTTYTNLFVIVLFLAAVLAFAGCGGTESPDDQTPACDVPAGYVLIQHDYAPNCDQCGTETPDGYDHRELIGCVLPGGTYCAVSEAECPATTP